MMDNENKINKSSSNNFQKINASTVSKKPKKSHPFIIGLAIGLGLGFLTFIALMLYWSSKPNIY